MTAARSERAEPGREPSSALGAPPSSQGRGLEFLPSGWDRERDLVVVAGRGAGRLAALLRQRGQRRVVLHRGPWDASEAADPAPGGVAVTRDEPGMLGALRSLAGVAPTRAVALQASGGGLSPERLKELTATVEHGLAALRTARKTVDRRGRDWVLCGARNLPRLAALPSIAALAGAFEGACCAVVSPGPSLSKNVHLLRELEGRALIVAGSHALLPLQRAGVRADVVVCADPGDHVLRHFEGVDLGRVGLLLVGAANHPGQFELRARRTASFGSNSALDAWLFDCFGERADLDTGGSVACSALSFALHVGCTRVLLVGQDLALDGGRYYVESAHDGGSEVELDDAGTAFVLARDNGPARRPGEPERLRNRPEPLLEVPGWHGGTVRTPASLHLFLGWFEAVARAAGAGATGARAELWNCTEGGARIDGMRHATLRAAIDAWKPTALDVEAVLAARLEATDARARAESAGARVDELRAGLELCLSQARLCDDLARRALSASAPPDDVLARLGREESRLGEALRSVPFVSLLAQERIRGATERAGAATDLRENLAAARELFGVVAEAGELLREPLAACREELARVLCGAG